MKQAKAERYIMVALFVFVLVLFSVADRDSKKIKQLYTHTSENIGKLASLLVHTASKN